MEASSEMKMMSEPVWVLIMKPFQVHFTSFCLGSRRADTGGKRSHVLTHAAGSVMHRILDMPARGGLVYVDVSGSRRSSTCRAKMRRNDWVLSMKVC